MTLEDAVAWYHAGGVTADEFIIAVKEIMIKEEKDAIKKVEQQKSLQSKCTG